jgi:hypothetical protein
MSARERRLLSAISQHLNVRLRRKHSLLRQSEVLMSQQLNTFTLSTSHSATSLMLAPD